MNGTLLDKLSEGQKACLRLVARHFGSKEIARQLGISPHTVDQRIKVAMGILGAASRFEAARQLADHEQAGVSQPLVYQASDMAGLASNPPDLPSSDHSEAQQPEMVLREYQAPYAALPLSGPGTPNQARDRPSSELTPLHKLAAIAGIAIGSAFAFGAILAGLEALSRLT
jgi:DNA-binding CsgD family transcriptional regulator